VFVSVLEKQPMTVYKSRLQTLLTSLEDKQQTTIIWLDHDSNRTCMLLLVVAEPAGQLTVHYEHIKPWFGHISDTVQILLLI